MNRLIETMWKNRGYTDEFFQKIMSCNHSLPEHIDEMCAHLKRHHDAQNRVTLLTDFDMDGIMSGVVGYAGLAELGFNVALYLPSTEAYGFGKKDIQHLLSDEQYPDTKAIVTADVGITAFDGVTYAMNHAVEMLVTDHHHPMISNGQVNEPNASVIVDPVCDVLRQTLNSVKVDSVGSAEANNAEEEVYDFEESGRYFDGICGAHVLYLVLHRYAELYCDTFMVTQIERLRVFAGFGTVSDSMPVWYENRPLIKDAIGICRLIYDNGEPEVVNMLPGCEIYRRAFAGLFVAMKAFCEAGKITDSESIDEQFFGYYLAPAFNSVKRMGKTIDSAYSVFFGGPEEATEAMKYILELTEERKALVNDTMEAMLAPDAYQPFAPYIYITNVIPGVCGLLAQRILSQTGEPAFVVCPRKDKDGNIIDGFVGSGRCPSWFPFLEIVSTWREQKLGHGGIHPAGHEVAFGVTFDSYLDCEFVKEYLPTEIKIRKQKAIDSGLALEAKPDFRISTIDPEADTDIDVELFEDFLMELDTYRPFGASFPEPDIELEFNPRDTIWTYLGKEKSHIKAVLPHGLVLICFHQADYFPGEIKKDLMPDLISIRGKLNLNEWNGYRTVQFMGSLPSEMDQRGENSVMTMLNSDSSDNVIDMG